MLEPQHIEHPMEDSLRLSEVKNSSDGVLTIDQDTTMDMVRR